MNETEKSHNKYTAENHVAKVDLNRSMIQTSINIPIILKYFQTKEIVNQIELYTIYKDN